jgi:hypothetical protein
VFDVYFIVEIMHIINGTSYFQHAGPTYRDLGDIIPASDFAGGVPGIR